MGDTPPKVEFALGSEVSPGHFFKSSFARTIASCSGARLADTKSLDYDFYEANNPTIVEEPPDSPNNFYSLVNFDKETEQPNSIVWAGNGGVRRSNVEVTSSAVELSELDKLRKKCQTLTEENERLQSAAATTMSQPPHVQQVIDSVYLQQQVNTLQWQLKQSETSRQMYRSLMGEVARFLDRARKSLDLIHERSSAAKAHGKDKSRVPRSRSVHAVHVESPGASSCASSTTSSTSSSSCSSSSSLSSSRFSRAKSVAQISSTGNKDFTWSALRRNDPAHCTPPRAKGAPRVTAVSAQDVSKAAQDGVGLYRRPKQMELDPDDKPPEKLSQEAFRLMRTVQSLLVMREPDLARVSPNQDSPLLDHHHHHQPDNTLPPPHTNFANSTALQDSATTADALFDASSANSQNSSQVTLLMSPGARQSIDSTASSKATEDENFGAGSPTTKPQRENGQQQTQRANGFYHAVPLSSTPNGRRVRKTDRKELHLKSLRDWALGNSNGQVTTSRPKPATSVSSAEDESGFSSMSSFQEVGLPQIIPVPNTLSPIKGGCHTEVGLPEVPIEKVRHRRWSSTPAEFHALLKRHSGSFANGTPNTTESLSVWV